MKKKILVMGLPGSGKSYLSKILSQLLEAVWLNADEVRAKAQDFDFSVVGRERQANRMSALADKELKSGKIVIADFICPTEETRNIFNADFVVYMNTIKTSQYDDTNRLFVSPNNTDFQVEEKNAELIAFQIANEIVQYEWDNKKPTVQMLGRYQPWHEGHIKLFEESLKITGQVNIMLRDVHGLEDNPFDFETIKDKIIASIGKYGDRFRVSLVPNITNICYGRDVGYKIQKIILDDNIQKISATSIRNKLKSRGKL